MEESCYCNLSTLLPHYLATYECSNVQFFSKVIQFKSDAELFVHCK